MLFTYEELQNYISLNAEDENTDRMLLTSSYNTLKKILNFELEERNYTACKDLYVDMVKNLQKKYL